ncbi:MAG: bifunctional 2-polyprenyl-6-hydroxyphenol methylase/3-demethylubiquinol 3-O-methyltransferase UbiG [Gammaproteobacteria bacterium]|nr:bifunctional 2-polyprenyl-6-hydroxyphenol methylase/3-demethylubiquinol 3-O-methyltransferase UbiG [Gammaproteobacteria bacterium]MDH5275800.1 bifunctional 2-polyprenyl-6-hydroxyphenol methylase/3-demethylubiquinol 3-O-methyltransferase UbiG [Gammaproteobacteria bacterium]
MTEARNSSPAEIAHFSRLASRWWDPNGEFRTLHVLNPVRLDWVDDVAGLPEKMVVDVGCGGGLLSEAMARRGAKVTGIDMSADSLAIARLHLLESAPLHVDYREMTAEDLAAQSPHAFDIVTCMELLEHVPDPQLLVRSCAALLAPGGSLLFSTINRTPAAFATAILGAEYLTRLVPRGTHHYEQLIRPSELDSWARQAGLHLESLRGGTYNPANQTFRLTDDTSVNYFAHFRSRSPGHREIPGS